MLIARDLHKTPQEIDRMPFVDVRDLGDDMIEHPPVHLLVAGAVGFKSRGKGRGARSEGVPADIASRLGGKVMRRG